MYTKRTERQKIKPVEASVNIDEKMMSADFKRIFELGLPPVIDRVTEERPIPVVGALDVAVPGLAHDRFEGLFESFLAHDRYPSPG